MASLNRVHLMGNLTRDPEVRYTPSGRAVCDLGMAVNRRFRGSDGQDREETCFVNVTAWGWQAEAVGRDLRKGSPVVVDGRLKYDQWERDGQKHSRLSVVAQTIQPVQPFRRDEMGDTPPSQPAATQQYAAPPAAQPPAPQPPQAPVSSGQPAAPAAQPTAPEQAPPTDLNDTADDDNLPF
jgi:single-strand DNA-binding protein